MYTQCPACSAAFRVTANDLRQAAGKVRCGGCGRAFDALEFLSEEMPDGKTGPEAGPKLPELKPDRPGKRRPQTISPEDSIALLKTLDQLAGSDIRLEDTGIEWRVLDDQVVAALEAKDRPASTEAGDAAEQRYDDDTPLDESAEEVPPATGEPPRDEELSEAIDGSDLDVDEAESGEWEEILDEFDGGGEDHRADEASDDDSLTETIVRENDGDTEPRDEAGDADDEQHGDVSEDAEADDDAPAEAGAPDESAAAEDDTGKSGDAVDTETDESAEPSDDATGAHDEDAAEPPEDTGDADDEDAAESMDKTGDADREEAAELSDRDGDADNEDIAEAHGEDDDEPDEEAVFDEQSTDVREEDVAVETIILEGDTVRSALDDDAERPSVELPHSWVPVEESVPVRRSGDGAAGKVLIAAVLLAVLVLQGLHQNRTRLATIPAVHGIIGPVYRAVGMPLVPNWDVRGWRFEATQGNTDADQLVVYSRLGNTADQPLPYPLIGVSLTDRFEETVGGILLEPVEYLAQDQNPRDPVAPGATFDAVITLQSPDPAATGYRLRACYRAANGKLRCAVGDFRE